MTESTTAVRPTALVVGGGIGGMAAAVALQRVGWRVSLLERAPEFTEVGAGVQLGPNVTRVLRAWGLDEAVACVAAFPDRITARSALSGADLGTLPLGARCLERYGAPYASIHRADLHRLLWHAARDRAGVTLRNEQWVEQLSDDETGPVSITTVDGHAEHGDALVGADGVWSRVRQLVLNDGKPRTTGHVAYRAMLVQQQLPQHLRSSQVTVWLGPRLHVVQYPVRGGDWMNVVAIVDGPVPAHPDDWSLDASTADIEAATAHTCAPLRDLILAAPSASANAEPWRLWALADRPPVSAAAQMARGRVALLGDAAHPMRPYLAQGAGMAIEDAQVLATCLAFDAEPVAARLARYADMRWRRCARVQAGAIRNGGIYHATGLMRLGRDAALRALGERVMDRPWLYSYTS